MENGAKGIFKNTLTEAIVIVKDLEHCDLRFLHIISYFFMLVKKK